MSPFSLSFRAAPAPLSALEVASSAVSGATFERRGGRAVVVAHAVESLPEQALQPALSGANLLNRRAVVDAITRVLERIGRPRRIGLVLEDPVAKLSLVRLQQVPTRASDLDQILRWQIRRTVPFPVEEAQVSHVPGLRMEDGQEFIVTIARRDVIVEYETACGEAGAHAGVVDVSTANVVNAAIAAGAIPTGDCLLVNVTPEWASMAVLRDQTIMFFRSRVVDGAGALEDLVHQTAMYYEDRLQGTGLVRALVRAAPGQRVDGLTQGLAERLGLPVEMIDPTPAIALADPASATSALLHMLTPLGGLVLRGAEVAA